MQEREQRFLQKFAIDQTNVFADRLWNVWMVMVSEYNNAHFDVICKLAGAENVTVHHPA